MVIYIFQSGYDRSRFAYTSDQGGTTLPTDLAPWHPWGGQTATTNITPNTAERDDRIKRAIETDGYYLFSASPEAF
jgi:hypothetical protein